jgi:hypothetical protein
MQGHFMLQYSHGSSTNDGCVTPEMKCSPMIMNRWYWGTYKEAAVVKFKVGLLSRNLLRDTDCNKYIQRQARELISGPSTATNDRLSFNRTQSRVVTGLLTGHNTLRRHLYVMGLSITPILGSVVLRRKPQSTFCVGVRTLLHSEMYIWVPSFWTWRMLWI